MIFILHIIIIKVLKLVIYFFSIFLLTTSKGDNVTLKILKKYTDFAKVFYSNLLIKILKNIDIKDYIIKLFKKK